MKELSKRLQVDFGNGYSIQNLRYIWQLYLTYPNFIDELPIRHAPCGEFITRKTKTSAIHHALRGKSDAPLRKSEDSMTDAEIPYAPRKESWRTGRLRPNLSWTHYRTLLRVAKPQARAFYEIEAIKNNCGLISTLICLSCRLGECRDDFKKVADDADMGDAEDRRVGIFVDGNDPPGVSHAG